MKGFKFNVCVPGFCYFRKPTNTAYLDTYYIPPHTTIRGLFANAFGLSRGDLRLQEDIIIGIRNNSGDIMEEYAQLLKEPKSFFPEYMYAKDEYIQYLKTELVNTEEEISEDEVLKKAEKNIKNNGYKVRSKIIEYSTSPMKRRVMLDADFTIYVASDNEKLISKLRDKLISPERPLYLGPSDSMADVYGISTISNIEKQKTLVSHSVCTGIHSNGTVTKLPYKFVEVNKKINLKYSPIITVFNEYPARMSEENELYRFENEYVCLL